MPQVADCRAILDAEAYNELVNRIGIQTDLLRSQLTLACRFIANAIDEHQEYKRFFDYWTAAYGENIVFVDQSLSFKQVANLRHELIHRGYFIRLEPEIERIMQGYFIDLIRFRIGLPCLRLTQRLQV